MMQWSYDRFDKPNFMGYVGAWRATGPSGIEYSIVESPVKSKRRGLIWSNGPGGVTFTGRGPKLDGFKEQAEKNERDAALKLDALAAKPAAARRERSGHPLPHSKRRRQPREPRGVGA